MSGRGKHRIERRSLGRAGVLVAATGVLLASASGMAVGNAGAAAQPVDVRKCNEAQKTAEAERREATAARASAEAAEARATDAKAALTAYDASHGGTDQPPVDTVERGKLVTDVERAQKAATEARATAGTEEKQAEAAEKHADAVCTVPPGKDGEPGKTIVDERLILLDRGVCARAKVTENPRPEGLPVLVEVIVISPCPAATPHPPTARPNPGDEVIVIDRKRAPKPDPIEADLPVTH